MEVGKPLGARDGTIADAEHHPMGNEGLAG